MGTMEEKKMLKRAEVILKVQCKMMKAADAARELGVARKTYYKWENKAIAALKESLSDSQGGRPSQQEDPKLKQLEEQNRQLQIENRLLQMKLDIQKVMVEELPPGPLIRKSKGCKCSKKNR